MLLAAVLALTLVSAPAGAVTPGTTVRCAGPTTIEGVNVSSAQVVTS